MSLAAFSSSVDCADQVLPTEVTSSMHTLIALLQKFNCYMYVPGHISIAMHF